MGRGRGRGRAPCCEKVGLKKGSWTRAEDMKLVAYIQQHGHANWRALPKQAGLLRCGKSCRLRWINYLRPDIKRGNFTQDEEETIIRLHHLLGNKWSKIASHLAGRTDNEIKNIWNTHLKKRITHSNGSNSPSSENSNQHKEILNSEQLNMDSLDMLDELSIMESEEIMSSLSSPSGTIDGAKTIPVEPDFDIWDMFDHDTLLPPPESSITTSSSSSSSSASPNTKSIDHCSSKEVLFIPNEQNIDGRHVQEPVFIDDINQMPFDLDLDVVGDVFDNNDAWLVMGDTTTVGEVEMSGGGERENHNWVADLERELGLWGSSDGVDQFDQQQNVQVSSYFQTRPSSPFLF
ncbi:hypothetical protein QJS04_geneDACA018879 [Acorus gramineus]|uniref:Uncharacterized protein n=1 Tax=Acorus gramineus TaxID=55184 RepID=A0AAV9BSB3_ACOGR|nr:hypothetical protein QJS04_geneDACA018879 [Acorus gramineus]